MTETQGEWESALHAAYREAARSPEDGVEIDDNAPVSEGDDPGAYVQAWIWVPHSMLPAEIIKRYDLKIE